MIDKFVSFQVEYTEGYNTYVIKCVTSSGGKG